MKCIAAGARFHDDFCTITEGPNHISRLLAGISEWLEANRYESMEAFHGVMGHSSVENPEAFERANYMKVLGSFSA